jgi:hypothetical protein
MNNLRASLAYFSKEELSVLQKIVKSDGDTSGHILYKLERILLSNLIGIFQANDSYKKVLEKVARHNNITIDLNLTEVACERDLYFKLFKKELDQMNADDKEEFYLNLEKQGLSRAQVTSLSGLATLGAAQASGFGVYLLASSTAGAIASVVGITLPFALYTSLSTAISYLIGPIGFVALGYTAYKSFKNIKSFDDFVDIISNSYKGVKKMIFGDYERATFAFKYITSMRFLLESNYEKAIQVSTSDLQELEKNKMAFNEQIVKNNAGLKIIYDQIYEVERKLKELNGEKAIINFKNKEVQIKINSNNEIKSKAESLMNTQVKKLADFKSILSK